MAQMEQMSKNLYKPAPNGAPTGRILSLGILSERIRTERIHTERILATKYPILNVSYLEHILLETYPLS